eukprot:1001397-Prymnesium_polylepis.1
MSDEITKHLVAGQKAYKAGSLDGALDMAKRALKAGGNDTPAVHLLFGAILTAQDDFEMAERALRTAIKLEKDGTAGWKGLAALFEKADGQNSPELLE